MPSKRKILETAKKNFNYAASTDSFQRQQEIEDLQFQVPELQWPEEAREERKGGLKGDRRIPDRPTLSISKIEQPISLVLNAERNAKLGINIHPLSPDAEDDTAEVIQGIYNQIQRDSRANIARSWAFGRAVKAGRGVYRVNTRYADEQGGDPFDQVITIERILYQESVYFDPAAQEPDFSDAGFAFVTSWVPKKRFEEMYPKAQVPSSEDGVFQNDEQSAPEWVSGEGEQQAVLIAEYFYREMEEETIRVLAEPVEVEGEVIHRGTAVREVEGGYESLAGKPLGQVPVVEGMERKREVPKVYWCKLTGAEVLEGPVEWNGRYIPLIAVLGRELHPFDERRRWMGMIRPAADAQRTFNYATSSMVERAALEPKAPYIGDPRQFEGYEKEWELANQRNFPFLPYNATMEGGQMIPPPQRSEVSASAMAPQMALAQMASDGIQAALATFSPSLGTYDNRERSGRAIMALQEQGDLSNSDYIHQLVNVSMTYEAKVVLDLIPRIYDRKGRIVQTVDDEDNSSMRMLNQPFVMSPDGKPVPILPGAPPPPPNPKTGKPPETEHYDLTKGIYGVAVSVGRSYQTRMQQGAEDIGRILESAPDLMTVLGDVYFKFRDFPGAEQIAERLKTIIKMKNPGLIDDEEGPSAAELQAQLQQVTQQLQAAQAEIQTKQAQQQATLQKSTMDNQTRLEIARMDNETKLMIQRMESQLQALRSELDWQMEEKLKRFEAAHDLAKTAATQVMSPPNQGGE